MPNWVTILFRIAGGLFLGLFFGLVIFCLALLIGVEFGSEYLVVIIVSSLVMFYTAVIIHEAGHLLAALAVGFRILLFAVGRRRVLRTRNGFQVRGIRRSLKMLGAVIALPASDIFSRRRMVLFISGGSLANLLTASLCFWGAFQLNETVNDSYPPRLLTGWKRMLIPQNRVACWFYIAGLVNLLLVLELLIPIRRKGRASDAAQLLDLFRNRHVGGAGWLVTFLYVTLQAGIRPRDWDAPAVERLLAARTGNPKDVWANVFGYYYAMDTGQIDLAGQLIALAVEQREAYPLAFQPAILQEAAYLEARYRHNTTLARERLQQAQEGQVEPRIRLRAEAAAFWAEGHFAEGAAKAQEALTVLPHSKDPGGAIAEGDWLRDILVECQKGLGQSGDQRTLATT